MTAGAAPQEANLTTRPGALPDACRRVGISGVSPGAGRSYAVKRIVGDAVVVEADLVADGHDVLRGIVLYRRVGAPTWKETALEPLANDRWRGSFILDELGAYEFTVEGWVDAFATWRRGLSRKVDAGLDVPVELLEGARLVHAGALRTTGDTAKELARWAAKLENDGPASPRIELARSDALAELMATVPDRSRATRYSPANEVFADPPRARFSAWYELFPRSAGPAERHGTLADVILRLPYVAEMGFDILYLPPIHPIGRAHRKGPDNSATAGPDDLGSPWAIGGEEGGHKSVHPALGTLQDLERLVKEARALGIELAMDVALQASPDHPYVKSNPEWFLTRPDGSIQYAENPPKKYQDIYPFDFECEQWVALWEELRSIFLFWIERGVTVFRVDNPHTKPISFWRWCIGTIKTIHPQIVFLAEAFTRPKLTYALGKAGFTQSYTYFTWRTTKTDLTAYMRELTTEVADFFRPNFWPNTPDILPEHLQTGGRGAFVARAALAALLSSNWGVYGPVFELMESVPRPGAEEYAGSEKYARRSWDWEREDSLRHVLARLNRIRREHPALQTNQGLGFHTTSNDLVLAFSKGTALRDDVVLCVVNLDPHHKHSAWVDLDLPELGLGPDEPFQVHDAMSDARYAWRGPRNFVELDPAVMPVSVFIIRRLARSEQSFEYYL